MISLRLAAVPVLGLSLALSASGAPPAKDVERLLSDLKDAHWQVRVSAAEALGGRSDERAVSALRAALHDESPEVRNTALGALARAGAQSALDDIRARIASDDERQVVVAALFAFGALGGGDLSQRQADIDMLVEKASAHAERVASAGRRVLFKLLDRRTFVRMIRSDLHADSAEARRRGSSRALALKLPELSGWEHEFVRDADPAVRRDAYAALGRDPKPRDLSVLLAGLTDASPAVRQEAVVGLGELDDPAQAAGLEEVLGTDADADVRVEAATALAWIRRIPGAALPALWHFESITDRLLLEEDGSCSLQRDVTISVDRSPAPIRNLKLLLPGEFPTIDRVLDARGESMAFSLEADDGFHYVVLDSPPIPARTATALTLFARSRRPVSAPSHDEVLVAYAPAPVQARVRALQVVIAPAAGGARGLSVDRTDVSPGQVANLVVRAAFPASVIKDPRTLPRSYSRRFDFAVASGVAGVVLACLVAAIIGLRRRLGERANRAVLVLALTTGAFFFLCPILLEDNLAYYAWTRSAVIDGDLDRMNEFSEFNQTQTYAPDGRGAQDPAFGSAFHIPFVAAAHGLTLLANAVSPASAPNGFSFPYLYATALGDYLAVLIGCLACFSLVERRIGGRYALYSVLAVAGGTFLLLYAYAWTGSSFQPSFVLFALFLNHWDSTREARSRADWFLAGVLLGLLGMTRTLNLGFAVIPLLDWLHASAARFKQSGMKGLARHAGCGALLASGLVAGFAPQLVLQRLLDGVWLVDSYGVGTGRFSGLVDHAWGFFLSADGLFSAMPIVALIVVGFGPLLRHDRWLGSLAIAALGVQVVAIGSYEIYWGYFRYGTPYLVPSSPLLCLAIASLARAVHTRLGRWGSVALWGVTALCAARNGWCLLRQLADKMLGDWQMDLGVFDVAHRLLLLDRKLDGNVLRPSSELGCLFREVIGGLRAFDPEQIGMAVFWVSLLAAASFVVHRCGRWIANGRGRGRAGLVVGLVAVSWIAMVGWLAALAAKTDVDYDYHVERQWDRPRELLVDRLEPGKTYSWYYKSTNPVDTFSVITYLEGAASLPVGERVATVDIEGHGSQFHGDIRAGIDTADFEIDRPESRAGREHAAPLDRACFHWRVRDDSSHFYTAKAYRSVFALPLASCKALLKVTSTMPRGTISVVLSTAREVKIPRDPSRRRWIADRR